MTEIEQNIKNARIELGNKFISILRDSISLNKEGLLIGTPTFIISTNKVDIYGNVGKAVRFIYQESYNAEYLSITIPFPNHSSFFFNFSEGADLFSDYPGAKILCDTLRELGKKKNDEDLKKREEEKLLNYKETLAKLSTLFP